jgi:hypothetical protein
VRANGSHKPSFAAMQAYASQGDQLTEPCGVTTGPKITVASPASLQSYTGPMPIHVFATSSAGVRRIRILVDGRLVRNFDDLSYPLTLSGAIMWMGGKHISLGSHTLTVLAYDKENNVSQVSVTVFHGGRGAHGAGPGTHKRPSHHAKSKHRKHKKKHHRHRKHH